MAYNVLRLGVVADFYHKCSYEAHTSNIAKCFYEARHPPLRQTAVRCWRSVCRCSVVHCLRLSWCVGLVALLDFFSFWGCALKKIQMCHQMLWQFFC